MVLLSGGDPSGEAYCQMCAAAGTDLYIMRCVHVYLQGGDSVLSFLWWCVIGLRSNVYGTYVEMRILLIL